MSDKPTNDKATLSLPNPVSGVDIAIKLNKIPKADEVSSTKQYAINLEYNGLRLIARLKGKSWRKALSTVEEIESKGGQWSMAISGKLGKAAGKAIELDSAGVQVFEKKPKPEAEVSATEADTAGQST